MIVIVGESGSGKSTLQKVFIENNPKYKKVITYTTRPKRQGEIDGVDYHFVTKEKFQKLVDKDFFAEYADYRGWQYGTAKEDCKKKDRIAVLTPSGLRALKRQNIDVTSVYLYVDRRSRMIALLYRGDDIEESYRRNLTDVGQFDGIISETDFVIDNKEFHMSELQAVKCLEKILEEVENENI